MRIRQLSPDDAALDAVTALNAANVPAVGEADRAKIARLVSWSWLSLVAEHGADVVGFCIVLEPGADYESVNYRWFGEHYDDFVYLDRVAVDAGARGRGIGRALYHEVERLGAGRGWFTLEVNLEPRNDESLAFHGRLGFAEVGQQTTDYGFLVSLQAKPL